MSASGPLFIGVDGGGSGCRARIGNESGRVIGSGTSGPAALRLGLNRSLTAIEEAAMAAVAEAGLPPESLRGMHAVVGLSGIGRKGMLEALITQPHPFRTVRYVNDATIACLGAHRGADGGVVVVGTGSIALALVRGKEIRIGGYGFPISDHGSGAGIGLRAINSAVRAHDGLITRTEFVNVLLQNFCNDPFEIVSWAETATATEYAALAPAVMDYAEAGDDVARSIVENAAGEIDDLIRGLLATGTRQIALGGGLAARMRPWLASDLRALLVPPAGDALDGALFLARNDSLHLLREGSG